MKHSGRLKKTERTKNGKNERKRKELDSERDSFTIQNVYANTLFVYLIVIQRHVVIIIFHCAIQSKLLFVPNVWLSLRMRMHLLDVKKLINLSLAVFLFVLVSYIFFSYSISFYSPQRYTFFEEISKKTSRNVWRSLFKTIKSIEIS